MGSSNIEVIAGTYEEYLIGYNFISNQSSIVQSFAAHDHSGSIRSLCVSGHYLATGGTDDRIIVYDLKSRKEHCMLTHHNASVSCLQFTNNHSHLISGSSDGVLAIVRVGNWQVEKVWEKAHKGTAILDIAVHSSGKLALTLGADLTLRTWNLVKGRQAYAVNLNSKCEDAKSLEKIVWAEDGTRFMLYGGKYTEVWSIETGGILKVIGHSEKVCSCIWFSENEILVGYENGQLALCKIGELISKIFQAHASRVKVLGLCNDWIVSGSSTGEMKVWNRKLQEVAQQDSGCRITCLGIVPLVKIKEEEILEKVQEKTVKNTVTKRSTVIVEIDGDDDDDEGSDGYELPEVENKLKEETIEVSGDEAGSSKIKRKGNKKKLEKVTQKKRAQKLKYKKALVKDEEEKQNIEIVQLKGSYMGCGRKRKDIIDTGAESPKKERRRKLQDPIKTAMIGDGQPKRISLMGIMEHVEERRKIIKEREQIYALIEAERKKTENAKLMGPYMGCGRKRKEIIDTKVNGGEPKKRRRKLEKPVKKDVSVLNKPNNSLEEMREQFRLYSIEQMKKEKKRKQILKRKKTIRNRSRKHL